MKTYKQALKTPRGGWVKADEENMIALVSESIGNKLCISSKMVYEWALKNKKTYRQMEDQYMAICEELQGDSIPLDFISSVINL